MILAGEAKHQSGFFIMIIKHLFDNRYAVYDDSTIIAEFDIVENRITGHSAVYWKYGEDQLPIDIINKANEIEYYED